MINATNSPEPTASVAVFSLGDRLFGAALVGEVAMVSRLVDNSQSEGDEDDVESSSRWDPHLRV